MEADGGADNDDARSKSVEKTTTTSNKGDAIVCIPMIASLSQQKPVVSLPFFGGARGEVMRCDVREDVRMGSRIISQRDHTQVSHLALHLGFAW